MKIVFSFTYLQVVYEFFFCWTHKDGNQFVVPIVWRKRHVLWKSMGTRNCLVTNILQIIYFCFYR